MGGCGTWVGVTVGVASGVSLVSCAVNVHACGAEDCKGAFISRNKYSHAIVPLLCACNLKKVISLKVMKDHISGVGRGREGGSGY